VKKTLLSPSFELNPSHLFSTHHIFTQYPEDGGEIGGDYNDGMKTHSTSPPTYLPTQQPNQDEEYNVIMLEEERRKRTRYWQPFGEISNKPHHTTSQ